MRGLVARKAPDRAKIIVVFKSSVSATRQASTESSTSSSPISQPQPSPEKQRNYGKSARVLSGIQPTGIPHLGNYLGALRGWKSLQDEKVNPKHPNRSSERKQLLFSIVDLHALTSVSNDAKLYKNVLKSYASLLAIGLSPRHTIMFVQSKIHYHTQLMWILSTVASTGYLSRMTQWKSKLGVPEDASMDDEVSREKLKLGLFSYPVLQAADILLYRPKYVPVGEDQKQHIEFARSLAGSFNARYASRYTAAKPVFEKPRLMLSPAGRIKSLKDPLVKMSKSDDNPASRILITDSADEIQAKIRGAVTDSIEGITYDPEARPGIANLLTILKHVSNTEASIEQLAADNANVSMRAFKDHVAHKIIRELWGYADKFKGIMDPSNRYLRDAMRDGNKRAMAIAGGTMHEVELAVGLRGSKRDDAREKSEKTETEHEKKERIKSEQEQEEAEQEAEPDVLPQQEEGFVQPIAS